MKRIFFCIGLFCLLPTPTLAITGPYIAGNFVFATYDPIKDAAFSDTVFPIVDYVQPCIGFRIGNYFALESAFSYLVDQQHTGGKLILDSLQEKSGPDHYKLYALELAAKVFCPVCFGISVFGKVGTAYVHQDVFNQVFEDSSPIVNSRANKTLPTMGGGLSYNFAEHFACEASFTHIQGSKPIGNINMAGLGLSYTF